ncbi:helix-turn-helix domain-containing protein [Enterobacter kobei]
MLKATQDLAEFFITEGEDWEPGVIQAALKRKGHTVASLEREVGLKPGSMRNVFYRQCCGYEELIAQKIGVNPEVIWPRRYQDKNPQEAAA